MHVVGTCIPKCKCFDLIFIMCGLAWHLGHLRTCKVPTYTVSPFHYYNTKSLSLSLSDCWCQLWRSCHWWFWPSRPLHLHLWNVQRRDSRATLPQVRTPDFQTFHCNLILVLTWPHCHQFHYWKYWKLLSFVQISFSRELSIVLTHAWQAHLFSHRLSTLDTYYVPKDGSLQTYKVL